MMKSKQEIFNKVAKYLLNQKTRAYDLDAFAFDNLSLCKYKTADGNRCAIGILIPDEHPGLEYIGPVDDLLDEYPDLREAINPFDDMCLLKKLQVIHDAPKQINRFFQLKDMALWYNLDFPFTPDQALVQNGGTKH